MDEKDIMSTLSSWANEIGKDELKNIYENMINLENDNKNITDIKWYGGVTLITKEYSIAAAEVNKVLSYLPAYQIEKIPESLRSFLNKIEDKDIEVEINPDIVSLYGQDISQKAKEILAMIYTYYFTELEEITDLPPEMIEDAKEASSEIYGNKTQKEFAEEVEKGDFEIAIPKKEPWYRRIFKKFFKKKSWKKYLV